MSLELFNKHNDYEDFLERIKELVGYIEYEFFFEFNQDMSEIINNDSFLELENAVLNRLTETSLNDILFNRRISMSMRSGLSELEHYQGMFVKVLSVVNEEIIDKLKSFNTFYTYIEDEECFQSLRQEGEKNFLDPQRPSYGQASVKFMDKNRDFIISISGHEKSYLISKKYKNLGILNDYQ